MTTTYTVTNRQAETTYTVQADSFEEAAAIAYRRDQHHTRRSAQATGRRDTGTPGPFKPAPGPRDLKASMPDRIIAALFILVLALCAVWLLFGSDADSGAVPGWANVPRGERP